MPVDIDQKACHTDLTGEVIRKVPAPFATFKITANPRDHVMVLNYIFEDITTINVATGGGTQKTEA